MATTVIVEMSSDGMQQLATSPGVAAEMLRRAKLVERRAREQAEPQWASSINANVAVGKRRIHGSVFWWGGLPEELQHRILANSIDAARG